MDIVTYASLKKKIKETKDELVTDLGDKADKSLLESGDDHFQFGVDENGNYGYVKKIGGADTVIPFKTVGTRSDAITANGTYTAKTDISKDGYESVTVNVPNSVQTKTVTADTSNVTVTPDSGYIGMSSVTVQPTPSIEASVEPSTNTQIVTPESGKLFSQVTVSPISTQTKSVTPSTSAQTVTPDSGKYLSSVSVGAISPQRSNGTTANTSGIDSTSPYVYFPNGYYPQHNTNGSYVRMTAAQAVAACPKEEKTVTAGTSATSVTPSSNKLMSKVTVNPTPSQEKTVTGSRSAQTVTPDSGKLLSKVTVNKYPDASGTYTVSGHGTALDMGATNNYRYVNTSKAWNAGVNDAESRVASIIDKFTTSYERVACQPEVTIAQMQGWYRPYGADCCGKCGFGISSSRLYNEIQETRQTSSVVK